MICNYIVLFALINIVSASVVINVYEDGEDKASHSLRGSCNYQACDQLCRRLGFPGGACVGDKCQCDNFLPLNYQKLDDDDKASHSLSDDCNNRACDQLCRRRGFHGGACVGDKCQCYNFEPLTIKSNALDYLLKSRSTKPAVESCDDQVCDRTCKQRGYKGGICRGGYCYCWKHNSVSKELVSMKKIKNSNDDISENENVENLSKGNGLGYLLKPAVESCNDAECDQTCKNHGYDRGICSGGDCYCWKHNSENEGSVSIKKIVNDEEINNNVIIENEKHVGSLSKGNGLGYLLKPAVESCNDAECDQTCKNHGYDGGICSGGDCYCWKHNSGNALDYLLKSRSTKPAVESCDDQVCDRTCKQRGYKAGICSGGRCYCWNHNSVSKELVSMKKIKNSNDDISENENVENLSKGNGLGYLLKPAVESCNDAECDQTCKNHGYDRGNCSGGDCYCWKHNSENEGLVSIKKIVNDEEINNNVLSENEKHVGSLSKVIKRHPTQPILVEDSVQSTGDCNNVNCYYTCARMHYMGGSCIGQSCTCF